MKRRAFLRQTGGAFTLPFLLNGLPLSALASSSLFSQMEESDRALVIIQLNGGNDGLNTLIPLDQYDRLANARSNILVPEGQITPLTDTLGLHPAAGSLKTLYEDARLCLVQSVGYPEQNRSHFRSTDIWTSGSPADETWTSGWIGRYFERQFPDYPEGYPNADHPDPFAITMGHVVSQTCQGSATNFSLTLDDPFALRSLPGDDEAQLPNTAYGEELAFLRTSIAQTNAYSEVISEAAERGTNKVTYPENNPLANQLRNVALLLSGGIKTKVFVVSIGGFDTHANQVVEGEPITGIHAELLTALSQAIEIFQSDLRLAGLEEKVIGMTFSEFGRQIRSNASLGTDHGSAAPLMLFGSCIRAGIVGENPPIPEEVQPQEGVPMQYDFRDIYGSVLKDWFGVDESEIRQMLHPDFQYIPIVQGCTTTQTDDAGGRISFQPNIKANVFPNPFREQTRIALHSKGEWMKVSIYNALGNEIKVLSNRQMTSGEHNLHFDAHGLPPGNYYIRIQAANRIKTLPVVKI